MLKSSRIRLLWFRMLEAHYHEPNRLQTEKLWTKQYHPTPRPLRKSEHERIQNFRRTSGSIFLTIFTFINLIKLVSTRTCSSARTWFTIAMASNATEEAPWFSLEKCSEILICDGPAFAFFFLSWWYNPWVNKLRIAAIASGYALNL